MERRLYGKGLCGKKTAWKKDCMERRLYRKKLVWKEESIVWKGDRMERRKDIWRGGRIGEDSRHACAKTSLERQQDGKWEARR